MFDKNPGINLGVKHSIYDVISLIRRNFRMKQNCTIIEFGNTFFFSMTIYLFLFGINLRSSTKPSFSYP